MHPTNWTKRKGSVFDIIPIFDLSFSRGQIHSHF
jgi:hypothetical protein